MSTETHTWRDARGLPTERRKATFDPCGRLMSQCISPGCGKTPTHYLCCIDGVDYHTRMCDDCLWSEELQRLYELRLDPAFQDAA